jgi:hypothetical protein
MNTRRLVMAILIMIALITATLLITINVNLLKEMSNASLKLKKSPEAKESPELNYAIPSGATTGYQMTESAIAGIAEKRKVVQEEEEEAERARSARRAEVFARQKKLETSLPKKESTLPSKEEVKAPEKKGLLPF